jgi:uncharacterized protein (TIGR02246 family)
MKLNANNKDVMAVWALHEEVLASFNALDMEKLLSLHTDNIILMEPGMPTITGKKEVIRLFEKFRKQSIALNLSYKIDELEVFGEMAFVRGQVIKTSSQNNEVPVTETGKFITLSRKQKDGTWLRSHVIVNGNTPETFKSQEALERHISLGVNDSMWK